MPVFNVVKFRVKPGREAEFIDAHSLGKARWPGLVSGRILKTGAHTFCLIGEWPDAATLAAARSSMVATLNTFRDTLEDQGPGIGVTDATSGESILDL